MAEEGSWSWAIRTPPDQVTRENIYEVYHLNTAKYPREIPVESGRVSLLRNPFWIKYIGEMKWLQYAGKDPDFKISENDPDFSRRILGLRKSTDLAGLSNNFGSTCYANSVLQAWFHNPLILHPILFDPIPLPQEGQEEQKSRNVVIQLQKLFARMQFSRISVIDTCPFIQSLNLNRHQQDASEFSLLFAEKIIGIVPEYKPMFEGLFEGNVDYKRKCGKCGTESTTEDKFTVIGLGLQNSLETGLAERISPEVMDGDNQRFCEVCGENTDSKTTMSFKHLPPVLQFQVGRYQYNQLRNRMEKRKEQFTYPDKLDFSPYIDGSSTSTDNTYTVSASLLHLGTHANHGHYVVKVKDLSNNTWHYLSDDHVEKENNSSNNLVTIEEIPPVPNNATTNENNEQEIQTEGKNDVESESGTKDNNNNTFIAPTYSCSEVYMLVYVKDSELDELKNKMEINEDPPHLAQLKKEIKEKDNNHVNVTYQTWRANCQRIKEVTELFLNANQQEEIEDGYFISFDWIKEWIKYNETFIGPINNAGLLCPHDKVKPLVKSAEEGSVPFKVIPSNTAILLHETYGGGPLLRVKDSLCDVCVKIQCLKLRREADIKKDIEAIITNQKEFEKIYLGFVKNNEFPEGFFTDKKWLHKSFFNQIKSFAKQSIEEITSLEEVRKDVTEACVQSLLCNQRKIKDDSSNLKLINPIVWRMIEKYLKINEDLSADKLIHCKACEKKRTTNCEVIKQNESIASDCKKNLSSLLKEKQVRPKPGDVGEFYVVKRELIEDLKSFMGNPQDQNMPAAIINESLLCPHQKLRYPLMKNEMEIGITDYTLAEREKRLILLRKEEWEFLKTKILEIDHELCVKVSEDNQVEGNWCKECAEEWWKEAWELLMDFQNEEITIKFRDSVLSLSKALKRPKTEINLRVSGITSLFELRTILENSSKVPAKSQKIFFRGREILDDSKTLWEFGIWPKATLWLESIPTEETDEDERSKNLDGLRD